MSSLVIADGVPFLPDLAPDSARDRAAIGIRESTIVAIGDLADVRDAVGPGVEEIDAAGGLVTPGFVDAHVHLGVGAVDALRCDLAGAASLDEIDARIRRFASAHPGDWVVGGGWDPSPSRVAHRVSRMPDPSAPRSRCPSGPRSTPTRAAPRPSSESAPASCASESGPTSPSPTAIPSPVRRRLFTRPAPRSPSWEVPSSRLDGSFT
jgi:hypothetical protein|nr:amidohydrolase family protein [Microbacterium sp. 5K110]